jgi:hypothetical protein
MIVSTLLLSMLLSGAPQQTVVIKPNPNSAPRTSGRFLDNELRTFMVERRADLRRQYRDQLLDEARQSQANARMELADRLDRMISGGDCAGARALATSSSQADIAGEVERVCAAREAG